MRIISYVIQYRLYVASCWQFITNVDIRLMHLYVKNHSHSTDNWSKLWTKIFIYLCILPILRNNNFYVVQYSMENLFDKSIYRYLRAHILAILDIFECTWRALCEHELRSNVWPYHIYHTISWIWILYLFSDHAEYKKSKDC